MKFGADMKTAHKLVEKAQEINMEIIGVRYASHRVRTTNSIFFAMSLVFTAAVVK
jgi:hypothetical protein